MKEQPDLRFDDDRNIVYIHLVGPVSSTTLVDAFDAAISDSRYKPGMNRLWDLRDADLSGIPSNAAMGLGQHSLKFPQGVRDVKVAYVAAEAFEYGVARMIQAYSMATGLSAEVFTSIEEAEAWLSE